MSFAGRSEVACSAIEAQPAARADATFEQMKPALLFQGVMRAATPIGLMKTVAVPAFRSKS